MQLGFVFSEARTGLRRNVSMAVAMVITMFVSLTLVGMGLLFKAQTDRAEARWGSQLQINVQLCNDNSTGTNCAGGEVTDPQRTAIEQVLKEHPEVSTFEFRTKQQAYDDMKRIAASQGEAQRELYNTVRVEDAQESFRITLKDPTKYMGVEQAVAGMSGVDAVIDLHNVLDPIYKFLGYMQAGSIIFAAILLVAAISEIANTIRLTAHARSREIGIMKLVGAGNLSIQLPFLLETLVASVIGIALASATIAGFMGLIYWKLRSFTIMDWVTWGDAAFAIGVMAALGVILTVVPTLLMTRKYLKV